MKEKLTVGHYNVHEVPQSGHDIRLNEEQKKAAISYAEKIHQLEEKLRIATNALKDLTIYRHTGQAINIAKKALEKIEEVDENTD